MIFGTDIFASEEFAATREHGIEDWIELCPPLAAKWLPQFGLVGPCDDDNVTPPFGCDEDTVQIELETQDAARIWLNNILAR